MLYVRGYVRSATPLTSYYLLVLGDFGDATSESNPFAGQISKFLPPVALAICSSFQSQHTPI